MLKKQVAWKNRRWRLALRHCFSPGGVRSLRSVHPDRVVDGPAAGQDSAERPTEFHGHGVVDDRVNGAVDVDHNATEQQQPEIFVAHPGEWIVNDVDAVRQPQNGEQADHGDQHLDYLEGKIHLPTF